MATKLRNAKLATMWQRLSSCTQSLQAWAHQHPRRVSAAVLSLLAGSAVTALGVAPMSVLSDAKLPVVTQISEVVQPVGLAAQLAGIGSQTMSLYRSDVTRASDTADTLLHRLGVDDIEAAQLLRHDSVAATLLQGHPSKMVRVVTDNGRLRALVARSPSADPRQVDSHFTRLSVQRVHTDGASHWEVRSEQVPLTIQTQTATGTVKTSLYAAADDAHVPEGVINQIAEIFSSDIDFRHELRQGDAFSVLYEAHLADGEPVIWGSSSGKVLATRFINKDKAHDAVWFQTSSTKGAYFDLNGQSKTRAFLASPLAYSRVTSGFAMRMHPISHRWKAHLGVDFGAPTGTPVRSIGDALVTFAGRQNGYGNVIQLEHSGDRVTVYAHLSRINVQRGQRIEQGQVIGAVGATGWATGPHLHFEFKVKGQQVDPIAIARASESLQLSPQSLAQFKSMATSIAARLNMASEWQSAGAHSGPRFE